MQPLRNVSKEDAAEFPLENRGGATLSEETLDRIEAGAEEEPDE